MPFKKGQSGNPTGRKAGTQNKATTMLKEKVAALVEEQFDSIRADLELLEPKDRIGAYLRFLEYVMPKQREQKIDLAMLSDEQLTALLNKALSQVD